MFSHVGVCVLVVVYSIMGAFAFKALEASTERQQTSEVNNMRQETLKKLWDIYLKHNEFDYGNFTIDVKTELKNFQQNIVRAVRDGYGGIHNSNVQQWTFSGAFLYSLTVITTIGRDTQSFYL